MNVINEVVFHKTYGTGLVVVSEPAANGKTIITVEFSSGCGSKRFHADSFNTFFRFVDPAVQTAYERQAAEQAKRETADAARRAKEKKAEELALAEAEKVAREAKLAEILARIERDRAKKAEKEAAFERYHDMLDSLLTDISIKEFYENGKRYESIHSDRVIDADEYIAMSAYIINVYRAYFSEKHTERPSYSTAYVRRFLGEISDSGFCRNIVNSIFFRCVVSYLHYHKPLYKDVSALYETCVIGETGIAA